jgi:acyl-CoA reductase-like NAD-dependent aldehyde dehydrogenase
MSAFANSGQVCISLQRLYVHASIFEDFTRRFVAATAALKVGNPMERDCDVGPMISQSEVARVVAWIAEAEQDGARVLAGGRSDGSMLQPTVLCDVAASMNVMCQEVFAPVVCLVSYDDFDAALAALDDSEYGLQAGVWTNDLRKAFRAIERLDCGGVMVNDTSIFRVDHMPYGGNRRSGLGREGVRFAVEEMTNIKMVVIRA